MRILLTAVGIAAICALPVAFALADEPKAIDKEKEGAALIRRAEAFVAAFNKGDAKALAEFWTPDGDYLDQSGRVLRGRKAIEAEFQRVFAAGKGAKLFITPTSVRFLKPDLAIEDGTTEVVPADGPGTVARYTIIHVKVDGVWYLSGVRDAIALPPSNFEPLRDLEWLVGNWVDEADSGEMARASYSWSEGQNFVLCSFHIALKGVPIGSGSQRIGWDPAAKRVRSWSFDANGSFGEGAWSVEGNTWTVKNSTTLRDGKVFSSINRITRIDADHLTVGSTKCTLDGKPVPDIGPLKMKRAK
jgi:uncharacterized protein (TIGR02246 family)